MKSKILAIFLLLLVIFLEGCINQSSNVQSGQHLSTIIVQPGEKLYYIEGCGNEGFCNSNDHVGRGIAEFAKSHNITKIEIQYDKRALATGAYITYKE